MLLAGYNDSVFNEKKIVCLMTSMYFNRTVHVYLLWINRLCSASAYLDMIYKSCINIPMSDIVYPEIHKFSFSKYAFVSSMKEIFMKSCLLSFTLHSLQ